MPFSVAAIAAAAAAAPVEYLSSSQPTSHVSTPNARPRLSPPNASFVHQSTLAGHTEDFGSTSSEASAPDFRIPCVVVRPPSSSRIKSEFAAPPFLKSRPSSEAHPLPRTTSIGDDCRGACVLSVWFLCKSVLNAVCRF